MSLLGLGNFDYQARPLSVEIGDAAFLLNLSAGIAAVQFDVGDGFTYDRAANKLELLLGSADVLEIDGAVGNVRHAGYGCFGSVAVPANASVGDLTATRLVLGTDNVIANAATLSILRNFAASASAQNLINLNPTWAPATGALQGGIGLNIAGLVTPTANMGAQSTSALAGTMKSTGTFNSGILFGLNFSVLHDSTGTAAGLLAMQVSALVGASAAAGAVSGIKGINLSVGIGFASVVSTQLGTVGISLVLTGASATATMTVLTGLDISLSGMTSITSMVSKGINIADLKTGIATDVIGIDIAAQTAGMGVTAGVRNAAQTVFTPSSAQPLVAATAILANATSVQITAVGVITLTANPMIAAGANGQVLTIVNVGAAAITLNTNGMKYGHAGAAPILQQDSTIVVQYNAARAVWEQIGGVL